MSDLISRQDVILTIEDDARNGHYSCFASYSDAQKFKQIVNELPSAQQWIPCSERLPEKDTNVLGYIRCESFDYMNVLWRDDYSGDWADGDNFYHEVLAWMPLPEPWKGEADGRIH